jgi:CubicO group peptidase (beta-lactamase class C family)
MSGLSKPGLARMHRVLSGYIERGELPGLVALVSRDDDVHVEVLGRLSLAGGAPMQRDAIFRIASITKPVVAAAAMMLVEECRIRLDDAVDRWLPELANRRVLRSIACELDDTVPAHRPITVRDLLTFRLGFGSVMAPPDTYPIQRFIREYRLGGDGPPRPALAPTTDEWLRGFAALPLLAQPGERWMYNTGADVLGILIARVSGRSLGAFLRERLFEPLGMHDTAFDVPDAKLDRLPACYTGSLQVFDDVATSAWRGEPPFESGAGGLVSTIDDYFAFSRAMLRGGAPLLSPASVSLMTMDHLTPAQRAGSELFFGAHSSWGLGVAVDIARTEIYHTPGRYGWTGGTGTTAYIDPANRLIGILFTQRMMDSPEPPRLFSDFWTLAYGAISD